MQRRLAVATLPFFLATVIGLVVLWPPSDPDIERQPAGVRGEEFSATVVSVEPESCEGIAQGDEFVCVIAEAELREGPDEGETVTFRYARGAGTGGISEGDRVRLVKFPDAPPDMAYSFGDFERSSPLLVLVALFAAVVIVTSRWRGVTALIGLAMSIFVLVEFMLPAILAGENPLAVAIVGASAVMFVALYLAHGFNASTTTAVLGTLASLTLTAVLAIVFVEAASFTGISSEEATFLQISAGQINLEGLLLGGIIVGALGVLDDVTVTQASAVWELRAADPGMSTRGLYSAALRIGRDHIASTVNTLVLAYAGASLPLLLIFSISERPAGQILGTEVMAVEIVRTLVGSIGLVASVPITTALAAVVVSGEGLPRQKKRTSPKKEDDWSIPRAERSFWGDDAEKSVPEVPVDPPPWDPEPDDDRAT
jgi:uncharacterized membrane protein